MKYCPFDHMAGEGRARSLLATSGVALRARLQEGIAI